MKAVLVMDMPNCCDECFILDDNGDYPMCRFTQEIRGYNFRTRERKMDRCPLRPMPEKVEISTDEKLCNTIDWYDLGTKRGYNACIDKIIGE